MLLLPGSRGAPTWRKVNCGPSCGACSHRTIQASHGAGCWDVGRSMPLHLLIGHICGLPQEADPPPPGTSPADRPHTWDGVDYRKSRLSVPKFGLLRAFKLREGEPGVSPPIPRMTRCAKPPRTSLAPLAKPTTNKLALANPRSPQARLQ